jgi:hypothetical protein
MESSNRSWSDSISAAPRSILPEILTVDDADKLLRLNRKTLYEIIRLQQPAWAIHFSPTIRVSRDALLRVFRGNRGAALGSEK